MRVFDVDDETIDLLEAAAIMAEQALAARARRIDPDGVISRSFEMSRIKTADAIRQLRRPKPKVWSEFTDAEKEETNELISIFQATTDARMKDDVGRKLRAALVRYHGSEIVTEHGEPMSQEEADRRENAHFATDVAANHRRVREVRAKSGKGVAPPEATK